MKPATRTRMTTQRRVILDCLNSVKTHPTVYTIYGMARKRLPEISLATVYRNLDVLSEAGLVQRMDCAGAEMRFDGNTSSHCHARCLGCGKVVDVDLTIAIPAEAASDKACGFKITGHRVELLGLCPRCAGSRRNRIANEGERP